MLKPFSGIKCKSLYEDMKENEHKLMNKNVLEGKHNDQLRVDKAIRKNLSTAWIE